MKKIFAATVALVSMGGSIAGAATVNGGTLLSHPDAQQLETWLGDGAKDFNHLWSGDAGVGTAADFHTAVDGMGPTFSLYDITLGDGSMATIGGYTSLDWGGTAGYQNDPTAFIFNLTTGEYQQPESSREQYAIYRHPVYFPTFGGGHDIFAGSYTLGTCGGSLTDFCDGYSSSHSYDWSLGQISVAGDSGFYSGDSGINRWHWTVNSIEVYGVSPTEIAPVPLPASLPLFLIGLTGLGLVARRRRNNQI